MSVKAVGTSFSDVLVEGNNGRLIHGAPHHLGAYDPFLLLVEFDADLADLPVYLPAFLGHQIPNVPRPFGSRSCSGRSLRGEELEVLVWRFQDIQRRLSFLPNPHLVIYRHSVPQDGFT